jgi:hypothetical protein
MLRLMLLWAALLVSHGAQAAEFHRTPWGTIRFSGDIVSGDAVRFDIFTARYPVGTYISLSSEGGSMYEMGLIGDIYSKEGLFDCAQLRLVTHAASLMMPSQRDRFLRSVANRLEDVHNPMTSR